MTKMLRVSNDVHEIIKDLAEVEGRTIMGYLNTHFRALMNRDIYTTGNQPHVVNKLRPSGTDLSPKEYTDKWLKEAREVGEIQRKVDEFVPGKPDGVEVASHTHPVPRATAPNKRIPKEVLGTKEAKKYPNYNPPNVKVKATKVSGLCKHGYTRGACFDKRKDRSCEL